ncbi:hypothetical protein QBC40DRAFT_279144 [Triangularia verruculosa]|uniref:Uncharacterized protein n=1 Tax=Triangularia verruculosa TaxID=2587418 RepID=A0AAN6XJX5_9PEZI|nr:hypothetical protein QBC40DRAFT_279144 [Triangularia verruculosa]
MSLESPEYGDDYLHNGRGDPNEKPHFMRTAIRERSVDYGRYRQPRYMSSSVPSQSGPLATKRWQHSHSNTNSRDHGSRGPPHPPPNIPPPAVIINNHRPSSRGPRHSHGMDSRMHYTDDDYDGYGRQWPGSQPPIIINNRIYQHSGESDYSSSDDESVDIKVRRTVSVRHHSRDTRETNHRTNAYYSSDDNESVGITYRRDRQQEEKSSTRAWHGESRRRARHGEDRDSSNEPANLFVDPARPQDITVHMSLPVQDDLEDLLEECSRLRRLGNFHEALGVFEDQLEHFFDNRYVLLQYGQCLLEAGQYVQLDLLAKNHWPSRSEDLLQSGWDMILHTANLGAQGTIDAKGQAHEVAMSCLRRKWPKLDSTEAQMLVHVVVNCKTEDQFESLGNWHDLYRHLINRGMIWEFRDIFQEVLFSFGLDTAFGLIKSPLHVETERPGNANTTAHSYTSRCQQLYIDLEKGNEDESTLFALLDIFTTLALRSSQLTDQEEVAERCMELATKQIPRLAQQNNDYAMSRPYLRWSVAKILIRESCRKTFEDSMVFNGLKRGELLFPTAAFPFANLPVYSPADDEVPHWHPKSMSPTSDSDNAVIRTVLQAAEELGDLDLQVGCLQELMYRGGLPAEKVVVSLEDIWSSTGQLNALKMLHLFRYMLAHTDSARRQLRRDILCDGEPAEQKLRLAQCMILRALAPSPREKEQHWAQARRVQREYHRVRFEKNWNDISSRQGSKDDVTWNRQHRKRRADDEKERLDDARERWELERAREQLRHMQLANARQELERAGQFRATQLLNEQKQTLRNQERLEEALALASLDHGSADPQDDARIDRRLDAIKREVEGIEGDIRRAQQTNDTKRINSLHHRLEELGLEKFGLEQERMKSENSRIRRSSTWPTDTDGISLDEDSVRCERQENSSNETQKHHSTAQTGRWPSSIIPDLSVSVAKLQTENPWPQVSEPLLLEYPGYGNTEVGDERSTGGSS